MKKCQICGTVVSDSSKYCSNCGAEVNSEVVPSVYESNDSFTREEALLNSDYAKRAKTAFTLSIVSIVLCCCTITSIISLILSITLMRDLNKLGDTIKTTDEYRKVKNKCLAALIISAILVFMGIVNSIDSIVNVGVYEDLYNSIYQDMLNSIEGNM